MRRYSALKAVFILSGLLISTMAPAYTARAQQVKISVTVANPSGAESRKLPVKYYLPAPLKPENVIDGAGLELDYDVEKGSHYLKGSIELGPKETHIYKITVEDVWKIPDEELESLSLLAREKAASLKGMENGDIVSSLRENIESSITAIRRQQGRARSIGERVKDYYLHSKKLATIKNDIFLMEKLARPDEAEGGAAGEIVLRVEVSNPSSTEKRTVPLKYELPPEITIRNVVDPAGLGVGFDSKSERVILTGEVELGPGEKREYLIKIEDVWSISQSVLDDVRREREKMVTQLVGTQFETVADYLSGSMDDLLAQIENSQSEDIKLPERIGVYRDNMGSLEDARKMLARLKTMMLQLEIARGGEQGERQLEYKKDISFGGGKAEGKGGGVGKGLGTALGKARGQTKQQRGGGVKAIRGLKGLILVSKSMFKGWRPELATTWKIILAIIVFLGFIGASFYILWMIQGSMKKTVKPLAKK